MYFLTFIYGVAFITIMYLLVLLFYSVYYTPGTTTLYNSPIAQALFPNSKKLFPTWGYNALGMYKQPYKFGQDDFWPESGKGYVPNKFGSPGASPDGLRPTFPIPDETEVGFWGFTPTPEQNANVDIYDNSSQHVEYKTDIGWWNS